MHRGTAAGQPDSAAVSRSAMLSWLEGEPSGINQDVRGTAVFHFTDPADIEGTEQENPGAHALSVGELITSALRELAARATTVAVNV
jgi:hypothetical protein